MVLIINECSWALISTHVHPWALMSTHKYGAIAQWALMSADERPWLHGAMLMTAFELSWVLIAPWPQAHECSWTLMSAHWQSGTLMVAFGCLLVPMSANGCSWGPVIAHEKQLGEAMAICDLRAMEQWTYYKMHFVVLGSEHFTFCVFSYFFTFFLNLAYFCQKKIYLSCLK